MLTQDCSRTRGWYAGFAVPARSVRSVGGRLAAELGPICLCWWIAARGRLALVDGGCLGAGVAAESGQDGCHMVRSGSPADAQCGGDLGVAVAGGEQFEYVTLAP